MNLIITSDHGMAEVDKVIELDRYLNSSLYTKYGGSPVYNIDPKPGMSVFLPPANVVCEGYVFTPVYHSVHKGGGVSQHAMGQQYTPPGQTPPRADTPQPDTPRQTPPRQTAPPPRADTPPRIRSM